MCFSESASVVSGLVIGGVGVATVRIVPDRRQLPFAALPVMFGVHQVLEGIVWDQLEHSGQSAIRTPAVEMWLLIAWLVLPIWVPLAVRLFEPDERRRRLMLGLAAIGVVIAGYLAVHSFVAMTTVRVDGHHLDYATPAQPGWMLAIPYIAAACLPMVLSSYRFVVNFGVALLGSLAITLMVNARALSSVWCFFAAALSLSLSFHYAWPRLRAPRDRLVA